MHEDDEPELLEVPEVSPPEPTPPPPPVPIVTPRPPK